MTLFLLTAASLHHLSQKTDMNHTMLLLLCVCLFHGLSSGCEFDVFSKAVESFHLNKSVDSHSIDANVGETINLTCESKCGNLKWFVNYERVRPNRNFESANVITSSKCINDDNTCSHVSHIDCGATFGDNRSLRSVLTITPMKDHQFLIQCEADLCGVELRRSVLLIARRNTDPSTSLPCPSTSTSLQCPSTSTSLPCPSTSTIIMALPSNIYMSNSQLTATPEPCQDGNMWFLAFIGSAGALMVTILLLVLTCVVCTYTNRRHCMKSSSSI